MDEHQGSETRQEREGQREGQGPPSSGSRGAEGEPRSRSRLRRHTQQGGAEPGGVGRLKCEGE